MSDTAEARLAALGVALPTPAAPVANYVPAVESRGMLYVSGQLPMGPSGLAFAGKVGREVDEAGARAAARLCAINVLAQAKAALGSLERIARIVKLTGFVNSTLEFADHGKIMNGASDFLVEVLGERGRHARSSVGMGSLPLNAPVEVEAVIEIR